MTILWEFDENTLDRLATMELRPGLSLALGDSVSCWSVLTQTGAEAPFRAMTAEFRFRTEAQNLQSIPALDHSEKREQKD
jgi:hypothetical protein